MEGRKTPSSSKESLSDRIHQVEEIKETSEISTINTANKDRPREGASANTQVSVNNKTLHTLPMDPKKSRSKVIAYRMAEDG